MLTVEELLSELIRFPTVAPEGNELECARFLLDYLGDLKVQDSEINIHEFDRNRANVVANFGTKRDPGLLLSGHMDVVPVGDEKLWLTDPFDGKIRDGKLFGRGASDMKGGVASMIKSIEGMTKREPLKRKLTFVATAGEETGFIGMSRLIKDSVIGSNSAKYIVIGEPTDNRAARAHRGIYRIRVNFFGKSSHASTPELGVNAIEYACKFVSELDGARSELSAVRDSLLGSTILTPTMIYGGIGENVIPPSSSVVVDCRRLPSQSIEEIQSIIELICSKLKIPYSTEVLVNHLPLDTPEENVLTELTEELSGAKSTSCPFGTEGALYRGELGIPTIVLGPGAVEQAHVVNEFVELSKLGKATTIYSSLIEKFCV